MMVLRAQEAPFQVRHRGNDRDYESLEALLKGLRSHYRGMSVAVHVRQPATAMRRTFFIDVKENGDIIESYGERPNRPVDIGLLKQAAVAGLCVCTERTKSNGRVASDTQGF